MPSRREQIQSYQYVMQRVVNAFLTGDPDPALSPMRRLAGAGFAGVMVAVLIAAVFGVIGVLRHGGNTTWRNDKSVIIEKETGTRYVYRDGVLYPVANYVSALLLLGQDAPTVTVSRESLVGAARGPLIGIVGAPDALPPASRMLGAPWALCAQAAQGQTAQGQTGGASTATSWLSVGRAPGSGTLLGNDGAVLVRDAANSRVYLLWNSHRYYVNNRLVLSALGIDQQPRLLVDSGWLSAVPLGPPLNQMTVDGRGQPSTALPGARIGQLVSVTGGGSTQFYLVRATELLPISAVEEAIELANPDTAAAYPGTTPAVRQLDPAQIAGSRKVARPARTDASPPERVPVMATVNQNAALCAMFQNVTAGAQFVVNVDRVSDLVGIATNGSDTSSVVDRVVVPAGYGAVVRAASAPDSPIGPVYLVTDQGRRYPVPNPQELSWLGYGTVKPVDLPSYVVSRLPGGPNLDPQAAQRPVATS